MSNNRSRKQKSKSNRNIGIVLLVIGIFVYLWGIYRNEPEVVEQKSSIICLECIGIG